MWHQWRPVFGWKNLCPVVFADPLGMIVVMPRAEQPVTFQELLDAAPDDYPDTTTETKSADFGRINGSVLALDYGLPYAEAVAARRAYYREKAKALP